MASISATSWAFFITLITGILWDYSELRQKLKASILLQPRAKNRVHIQYVYKYYTSKFV